MLEIVYPMLFLCVISVEVDWLLIKKICGQYPILKNNLLLRAYCMFGPLLFIAEFLVTNNA